MEKATEQREALLDLLSLQELHAEFLEEDKDQESERLLAIVRGRLPAALWRVVLATADPASHQEWAALFLGTSASALIEIAANANVRAAFEAAWEGGTI